MVYIIYTYMVHIYGTLHIFEQPWQVRMTVYNSIVEPTYC